MDDYKLAEEYDQAYHKGRGLRSSWHVLKFKSIGDVLSGTGGKLLDIGCGPGTFIGAALPKFTSAVGVDTSEGMIKYASNNYTDDSLTFIHVGNEAYPFEDESFDAITVIEVIEHLDDCRLDFVMSEVMRLLKPGGQLVISTPNYASWWPILEKLVSLTGNVDYTKEHIRHFNKQTLNMFLGKTGFSNIKITGILGLSHFFIGPLSQVVAEKLHRYEKTIMPMLCNTLLCAEVRKE
jgi:2-polyprenyl-3-methyl-5-hydroxy-6-metoxy-1,4-benzoquinol methylase